MYYTRPKTDGFAFIGGRHSNAKEFPHMVSFPKYFSYEVGSMVGTFSYQKRKMPKI